MNLMADVENKNQPPIEAPQDFYTWFGSEQGQKASFAQMRERCDKVRDAAENLSCSVSVFARMFEAKAANQLPEYYLSIKRRHARAIDKSPELKVLFSMFGSESISILTKSPDFSIKKAEHRELLAIHPYVSDFYIDEQLLPYIDVKAANGVSSRFILDTGASITRINYETARKMNIKLLVDSHYAYSTFYGESGLPAQFGILESLSVGGSEFKNILIFVSDRENILGLDLISKLGRIKITNSTLEVNSESSAQCNSRIVYARMDMNQRLTIAALLDSAVTLAIIDTGNLDYLTSSLPGAEENKVKNGLGEIFIDAPLDQIFRGVLDLPNNSMVINYKYHPSFTIPQSLLFGEYVSSILLGWRAFNDFEMSLDMDSGRSCFNKT